MREVANAERDRVGVHAGVGDWKLLRVCRNPLDGVLVPGRGPTNSFTHHLGIDIANRDARLAAASPHEVGDAKGKDLYALIDNSGKDNKTATADRSAFDFRPLGLGMQNIPSILEAAGDAGTQWVIVEQDRSTERPPMEAIKISREYLKTLGF